MSGLRRPRGVKALRFDGTDEANPRSAPVVAMQSLVGRLWSPQARWHVGEVAWSRSSVPGAADRWHTSWWAVDDRPVAWGWVESPSEVSLLVDPAHGWLLDEVLDWCLGVCASGVPTTCMLLETESALAAALESRGFVAQPDLPWFTYHSMPIVGRSSPLPDPVVSEGYRLVQVRPDDAARRAGAHRAGWSEFGSRMTTRAYERVMDAWPYRPELDWIVESRAGDWVASALAWIDEEHGCGILEPVSCSPEHRRRGLAAAVSLQAVHALRDAGATLALVNPRGDAGYPAPGRLYRGLGFMPGYRTVTYVRGADAADEAAEESESTLRNR